MGKADVNLADGDMCAEGGIATATAGDVQVKGDHAATIGEGEATSGSLNSNNYLPPRPHSRGRGVLRSRQAENYSEFRLRMLVGGEHNNDNQAPAEGRADAIVEDEEE